MFITLFYAQNECVIRNELNEKKFALKLFIENKNNKLVYAIVPLEVAHRFETYLSISFFTTKKF